MEDLKATALNLMNMKNVGLNIKISSLKNFKNEAEELLESSESERTQKDIQGYINWLERQIKSLENNCPNIVD